MANYKSSERELTLHDVTKKIDALVPHVLQLENAAIFLTAYISVLAIVAGLYASTIRPDTIGFLWIVPYASLPLLRYVIRIRNPYNRWADVVESGLAYAGGGALIGGSTTGLLSGGLGAPAGGAIGGGIGFLVGCSVGFFRPQQPQRVDSRCPECSTRTVLGANYCGKCGFQLGAICTNCRESSPIGSVRCIHCGSQEFE